MKSSFSFSYWAVTAWFGSVVFSLESTLGSIAAVFSPWSVWYLLLYWCVLIRSEWGCEVCNCPGSWGCGTSLNSPLALCLLLSNWNSVSGMWSTQQKYSVWRRWWVHWDVGDILFIMTLKVFMCKWLLQQWTFYRSLGLLNCWAVKTQTTHPWETEARNLIIWQVKWGTVVYTGRLCSIKSGVPIITLIVRKKKSPSLFLSKLTELIQYNSNCWASS